MSEKINAYYKYRCINARLGKYKRIELGFKRGTLSISLIIYPMMQYSKGGQGSGLYKLGLHNTHGVDEGSVERNKNQLDREISSFKNHTRRSSLDSMLQRILLMIIVCI